MVNATLRRSGADAGASASSDLPAPAGPATETSRFLTLYPGIYTTHEAEPVARFLALNRAIAERGPIDARALAEGRLPAATPGVLATVQASEDWVRYNNRKYDPENPLRHDAAYARQAGFADILAFPGLAAHDDGFMLPYPPAARDTLLVSDLNHAIVSHRPIHPGDRLTPVVDAREMVDLTPTEGSTYRTVAIETRGSVWNQRGAKVNDVVFRVTESIRIYRDPADRPERPGFFDMWESPDWFSRAPHVYTDADWQRLRAIWAAETRRGATPRYWEDVAIGERPTSTLDGPVESSVTPSAPWGMGAGGSRTLKREMLDAAAAAAMVRGAQDGIWRLADVAAQTPAPPADYTPPPPPGQEHGAAIDTRDIHKDGEQRAPLINFLAREFAIRHLDNWMGDAGWLHEIRWSIMDPRGHARYGKPVPANPKAEHWLQRVPGLEGRFVEEHGLTQDVAIVNSCVTRKEVRDGAFLVELVLWVENIEGAIWFEACATVRLPSRRAG